MSDTMVPGGTILRDAQGGWYYIRDDQLGPFRVTDPETLEAFAGLEAQQEEPLEEGEVEGFAFNTGFALLPSGPITFQSNQFSRIGSGNFALRADRGLGIGAC